MGLDDRSIIKIKYVSGTTNTPDVANAAPIQLYTSENRDKFEKDTAFIPIPKTGAARAEDAETLALDFKETNNNWTLSGFLKMGGDDLYSLPEVFRDSNNNGVVSGADDPDAAVTTTEQLSFTEFGDSGNANTHSWHLLGAKQIDPDTFILEDSGGAAIPDADYNVDYNRGFIEIFDNGNIAKDSDGNPDETLQTGYKYRGRNDTLARVVKRMAERGGPMILEIDPNTYANESRNINAVDTTNDIFTILNDFTADYSKGDIIEVSGSTGNDGTYTVVKAELDTGNTDIYVSEDVTDGTADGTVTKEEGLKFMAHVDAVEVVQNAGTPGEVEVSLDLREAVDKQ